MQCGTLSKRKPSRRSSSSSSSSSSSDKEDLMKRAILPMHVTESDDVASTIAKLDPQLLLVGTRVSQNLTCAPKAELVRLFRLKGHTPIQRNIRDGFIYMICKDCDATCSVSTYQRDAWYVTKCHEAVGRQCNSGVLLHGGF